VSGRIRYPGYEYIHRLQYHKRQGTVKPNDRPFYTVGTAP
jgi:hypothetical protein